MGKEDERDVKAEELWEKGTAVARTLKEMHTELHLYSDDHVRVYAVAVYKWTDNEYPEGYTGFRGDWAVYVGGAMESEGMEACVKKVMHNGNKLHESKARAMFGGLAEMLDKKGILYRP